MGSFRSVAGALGGVAPVTRRFAPFRAPWRRGAAVAAAIVWLAAAPPLPAAGGAAEEPASPRPPADQPEATVHDEVTVTATRLRSDATPRREVPAHVTVLDRRAIERAGATTLPELLGREAGVSVFDQVGNGIELTLDLRGFSKGQGTRVFLDGAPLNAPRNNGLALALVPLESLDRIEILRGSAATLAGGGSEAGVIRLVTRRSEGRRGSAALAAGTYDATRVEAEVGAGGPGRLDLFSSWSKEDSDGFRENAGGELNRFGGSLGVALTEGRTLRLSVLDGHSDLGNPGALTAAELARSRRPAPFNRLDRSDDRLRQASLNFGATLGRRTTFDVNVFARERTTESLTTGRAAPLFGGFLLDSDTSLVGSTAQWTYAVEGRHGDHHLTLGAEWLDGATGASGLLTAPEALDDPALATLASENTALRRTLAFYAQERWRLDAGWTLTAGVRFDEDRVGYEERVPDPANRASRNFSEVSLRGGLNWSGSEGRHGVWASWSESFLPPTVEQLFSFPRFGSNPGLEPEDARSIEVGYRFGPVRHGEINLSLFRLDGRAEILFDPDSPLGLFGANVNAGRTRRQGAEVALRGRLGRRLEGYANLTALDGEFASGEARGRTLPLVPDERVAVGLDLEAGHGLTLAVDGLYVGEQVLDNDDSNRAPRLKAYAVVDARLTWSPPGRQRSERGPELFAEVRNLFDSRYASRGIFAFDFSTFTEEVFLTPAPGRRFLLGARWGF